MSYITFKALANIFGLEITNLVTFKCHYNYRNQTRLLKLVKVYY